MRSYGAQQNKVGHAGWSISCVIILTVSAIGCGGGAQTASGSPTPTPVPSPTPASGSPSLSATPSSLAFGTQPLNTAMTQTVKITNTGSVAVAITQGAITGSGFTLGVTTPINLNVGQSLNVPVVFDPGTAGTVNGSLALVSNGTTLLSVPLSGTGLAALAHSVDVTWAASTSTPLQGYNVYRSTVSGGPYTELSPTLSPPRCFLPIQPLFPASSTFTWLRREYQRRGKLSFLKVAVTIPVP